MTPEERYALKEGWAEGRGRSRHAKVAALVPDWACPPQEEFIQAAKIGLWKACLNHREIEHGQFGPYSGNCLRSEFRDLAREYQKLSSQKQGHRQLDDSTEVTKATCLSREARRVHSEALDARIDGDQTSRGEGSGIERGRSASIPSLGAKAAKG